VESTGASKDAVDFDFSELADAKPATPDLGLEQSPQAQKFDLEFDVGSKSPAKVELPLSAASANDGLAADFDIDFDLDSNAPGGAATATRSEQTSRLSDLDLELPAAAATTAPGLDLKGISLDLDAPASDRAAASTETAIGDAPAWRTAATKLDLARAYLELGDKEGAKEIIDEMNTVTGFNPDRNTGPFALAASPARYMVERGDWSGAAELKVRPSKFAYTEAITCFTRALGAARSGNPQAARVDIARLAELRDRLRQAKDAYWADQVDIQWQAATAWMLEAEGSHAESRTGTALARHGVTVEAGDH